MEVILSLHESIVISLGGQAFFTIEHGSINGKRILVVSADKYIQAEETRYTELDKNELLISRQE